MTALQDALALVLSVRSHLARVVETLDLERAIAAGDTADALLTVRAELQDAEGALDDLGSLLTDLAERCR